MATATSQIMCLSAWCAAEGLNLDTVRMFLRERTDIRDAIPRAGRVLLIGPGEAKVIREAMAKKADR